MPDFEPMDPGENASLEARAAFARWKLERAQADRASRDQGSDTPPEEKQATAIPLGVAGMRQDTGEWQKKDRAEAAQQYAQKGRDFADSIGGNDVLKELEKQTALLQQILQNIGAKWG